MRSTTRAAAIAAAAAAVLIGSASTAVASSSSIDDKRYDVLLDNNTLASKGTYAQRVAASNIDVNNMTVNHGKNFVSIRINLHKLASNGSAVMLGAIKVNGGAAEDYFIDAAAIPGGEIYAVTYPSEGPGTECYAFSDTNRITGSSKAGTNGFVQLYIPRACFKNPKHLQAGGVSAYFDEDENARTAKSLRKMRAARVASASTNQNYFDPINPTYFGAPKYTKWLSRG